MNFRIVLPQKALQPHVRHLAISCSATAQTYPVLPDTGLVIGFQFSGRISYQGESAEQPLHTSGITGLLDQYRLFKNTNNTCSVLVYFTETGAADLLRMPLNELFGKSTSLENFFSVTDIRETQERLESAPTDDHRIAVIEDFLLRHIRHLATDQLVAGALHHIHQSRGTIRIAALTKLLHTSTSPLEKRFRAVVGASPKKFAGIVRARHMLQALNRGDEHTAEHLSAYYDQAHFIKSFKKFSSFTPEQYLQMIKGKRK